mgnify:CR=1 FL=1
MVEQDAQHNDKNLELKDFYRSKGSAPDIKIGQLPDVLQAVECQYYCSLFWALEKESLPYIIQRQREDEQFQLTEAEEFERKQEIIQEAQNLLEFERQTAKQSQANSISEVYDSMNS